MFHLCTFILSYKTLTFTELEKERERIRKELMEQMQENMEQMKSWDEKVCQVLAVTKPVKSKELLFTIRIANTALWNIPSFKEK